jgi:hypothetical protein
MKKIELSSIYAKIYNNVNEFITFVMDVWRFLFSLKPFVDENVERQQQGMTKKIQKYAY